MAWNQGGVGYIIYVTIDWKYFQGKFFFSENKHRVGQDQGNAGVGGGGGGIMTQDLLIC